MMSFETSVRLAAAAMVRFTSAFAEEAEEEAGAEGAEEAEEDAEGLDEHPKRETILAARSTQRNFFMETPLSFFHVVMKYCGDN